MMWMPTKEYEELYEKFVTYLESEVQKGNNPTEDQYPDKIKKILSEMRKIYEFEVPECFR